MNLKVILWIMSTCIAVLTVYPTTLWYIGRERDNENLMKKYKWKMLIGIGVAIVLFAVSVKI